MKRFSTVVLMTGLAAAFLCGCGGSASTTTSSALAPNREAAPKVPSSAGGAAAGVAAPGSQGQGAADAAKPAAVKPAKADVAQTQNAVFANDPTHKIIKNGDLTVQVDNVTFGINRITTVATANGGYILEVKSTDQAEQASTATLSFAVPVDHFEAAMQGVREASKKVLSEHATGQDVSQEFVDIQSQVANLEATQARVKTFLDQAKTVDEALKVNAQLSDLEGQINQLKGRLQFLAQRTAFSTITVQLQQVVGPTPTPTIAPTATPVPWHPSDTVQSASSTLRGILQGVAQIAIWLGIVVVPLLVPLIVVALLVRSLRLRSPRRPAIPPAAGDGGAPGSQQP